MNSVFVVFTHTTRLLMFTCGFSSVISSYQLLVVYVSVFHVLFIFMTVLMLLVKRVSHQ